MTNTKKPKGLSPAMAEDGWLRSLHDALVEVAAGSAFADVERVEILLQLHHGSLLRSLEREPSTLGPGSAAPPAPPTFPSQSSQSASDGGAPAHERDVAALLDLTPTATAALFADFERESHNDAQALASAAAGAPASPGSPGPSNITTMIISKCQFRQFYK